MRNADLTRLATGAILAHPLRSSLTMLGIMVGIAAVVLLTAIGEGVRLFVLAEFTQFGTNLIAVVPGRSTTMGISGASISNVRPLSLDDATALERLDKVIAVVPVVQGNARIEYGKRGRRTMVLGVGSEVPEVWRMPVAEGSFLPRDHLGAARTYAVLGDKMRRELFGEVNPLGKRIRVGGDRFRVIGVMAPKGQMLGFDLDDTIYIPVTKTMEIFDRESLMEIDVLYDGRASAAYLERQIRKLLIARHGSEDFSIVTQDQMLEVLDSIMNILTLGVAAIGSISLLVGAVGIVTIMTITVTERTAEIGLLRALGARRRNILSLFLCEAVLLGGLGGGAGGGLALGLILLAQFLIPGLPLEIAWNYVALALFSSLLIGVLSGIAPAYRAAELHPLDALRAE
ncbi:MAG: FtsX-like permease family protein [Gammaproteobacteria bacterium]|nr:MAG: FtsX-like permease family protein [Gammaproteobacteria bacterium]